MDDQLCVSSIPIIFLSAIQTPTLFCCADMEVLAEMVRKAPTRVAIVEPCLGEPKDFEVIPTKDPSFLN